MIILEGQVCKVIEDSACVKTRLMGEGEMFECLTEISDVKRISLHTYKPVS